VALLAVSGKRMDVSVSVSWAVAYARTAECRCTPAGCRPRARRASASCAPALPRRRATAGRAPSRLPTPPMPMHVAISRLENPSAWHGGYLQLAPSCRGPAAGVEKSRGHITFSDFLLGCREACGSSRRTTSPSMFPRRRPLSRPPAGAWTSDAPHASPAALVA
jgi:hypothetical protein